MDRALARFAAMVAARQGLMLLLVAALIIYMARWVYLRSLQTVTDAAGQRQALLAQQTARGIENYYAGIIETLDLIRRSGDESSTTQPTTSVVEVAESLAGPPDLPRGPREGSLPPEVRGFIRDRVEAIKNREPLKRPPGVTGPIARQIMMPVFWEQLRDRVSQLFLLDRATMRVVDHYAEPGSLPVEQIIESRRAWLENVKDIDIGKVGELGGRWGNIVAVPLPGERRIICAVVPVEKIEQQFLKPLDIDENNVVMLLDESGRVLSFTRPNLVGKRLADETDDPLFDEFFTTVLASDKPVTKVFPDSLILAGQSVPPRMTTVQPVHIPNGRWWLSIGLRLSVIEELLDSIFRRIFIFTAVAIGVFAFAFSRLAINQIRQRAQLERVRNEALHKEIEQARRIQLAWLPNEKHKVDGLDIAAINKAASHISGDFYNWFELADGRVCVVIGDVTGHGMSAAFLMSTTQLLLRAAMQRLNDPGKALAATNRELCQQVFNGQFVTILIGVIDRAARTIEFANAGHNPPVIIENGNAKLMKIEPQLVAGLDADGEYPTQTFSLNNAELLLYTDGVPEAPGEDGQRFDNDRLLTSAAKPAATSMARIEMLINDIDRFRASKDLADDATVVAVRFSSS